MANAFVLSRSHLIYGVCLPLAVLIGYVLADPLDSGSMAVVTLVFCVLSVPLIMRWHHVLLIASCNSWIAFFFAPGHPTLWMVLAFASLSLTLVNRSLGHYIKFFEARSVAYSLVCMALVVFATALFNGGIGIRSLGSSSFGGKKYVILCSAIILYFALAAQSIPRSRARLYTTLYFISSLMPLISYVGAFFGLYYLAELVPMEVAVENVESVAASTSTFVSEEINRLGDLAQ